MDKKHSETHAIPGFSTYEDAQPNGLLNELTTTTRVTDVPAEAGPA